MSEYNNIPDAFMKKLADGMEVKTRGKNMSELIVEIIDDGGKEHLEYLAQQCQFSGSSSGLIIIRPEESFPEKSSDAQHFMNMLVSEGHITSDQTNSEWRPTLRPEIQLCGLKQDGANVYIKLVQGRLSTRKDGYTSEEKLVATFASVVIHFNDQLIQLRCTNSDRNKYVHYVLKLMRFGTDKWHTWTAVNKEQAKRIASLLKADLVSTELDIPSTVGSVRFNADRSGEVNLRNDQAFLQILDKMRELNLPVDDTNDEICEFTFTDPRTNTHIPVTFEINIKQGTFKFKKAVTEAIIEHVIDAIVKVGIDYYQEISNSQVASSSHVNQ